MDKLREGDRKGRPYAMVWVKNSYKNSRKVLTNEIKNGKLMMVSEG